MLQRDRELGRAAAGRSRRALRSAAARLPAYAIRSSACATSATRASRWRASFEPARPTMPRRRPPAQRPSPRRRRRAAAVGRRGGAGCGARHRLLWAPWRVGNAGRSAARAAGCRSGRGCGLPLQRKRRKQYRHLTRWHAAGLRLRHAKHVCSPVAWINPRRPSFRARREPLIRSSPQMGSGSASPLAARSTRSRWTAAPSSRWETSAPSSPARVGLKMAASLWAMRRARGCCSFPPLGGRPRSWCARGDVNLVQPQLLPGGKALLFCCGQSRNQRGRVHHRGPDTGGWPQKDPGPRRRIPPLSAVVDWHRSSALYQQGHDVRDPLRPGHAGDARHGRARAGRCRLQPCRPVAANLPSPARGPSSIAEPPEALRR